MIFLMIVNLLLLNIYSKEKDSLKNKSNTNCIGYKQIIIPSSLIASGFILKDSKLNTKIQQEANSLLGANFKTKIDNYTQLVPIAQIYGGRFLGLKPKNDMIHQSINIFTAGVTMCVITKALKHS